MLDFEAALALAEAQAGVIPAPAAPAIRHSAGPTCSISSALSRATADAGNPAIPLVKALTSLVARHDSEAARYVHWGATSQDAMDTGLVLQLRAALDVVSGDLADVVRGTGGAGAGARAHADRGPHVAAAGSAGDAGPQARQAR